MQRGTRDRSLGDGVYFAPQDYVGLGPRIVIFLVDSFVLVVMLLGMAITWAVTLGDPNGVFAILMIGSAWLYLVALKRSRFRTLGYRAMGCKLVDLQGEPPSLLRLTFRTLIWGVGPSNAMFDVIWCGIDEDRQTMRDRYASVCVVKNNAAPIGRGQVHLTQYNALGYCVTYPHVVHPKMVSSPTG